MPYGEPVIQASDVKYMVNLNHPGGGWITINAATLDSGQEALVDVAVQDAVDLLVGAGWTIDQGTKSMGAAGTITPTPPE
jgi:hypothetical protein